MTSQDADLKVSKAKELLLRSIRLGDIDAVVHCMNLIEKFSRHSEQFKLKENK